MREECSWLPGPGNRFGLAREQVNLGVSVGGSWLRMQGRALALRKGHLSESFGVAFSPLHLQFIVFFSGILAGGLHPANGNFRGDIFESFATASATDLFGVVDGGGVAGGR